MLCPLLPTTPFIFEPIHQPSCCTRLPTSTHAHSAGSCHVPLGPDLAIRRTRSARELVNLAIVLPRRITGPFIVKTGCSHPSNHTHTPSSLSLFCLFHLFFPPFILVQPCECTPSLLILALVLWDKFWHQRLSVCGNSIVPPRLCFYFIFNHRNSLWCTELNDAIQLFLFIYYILFTHCFFCLLVCFYLLWDARVCRHGFAMLQAATAPKTSNLSWKDIVVVHKVAASSVFHLERQAMGFLRWGKLRGDLLLMRSRGRKDTQAPSPTLEKKTRESFLRVRVWGRRLLYFMIIVILLFGCTSKQSSRHQFYTSCEK